MLSLLKLCLLIVGLASAGSAIGIPLALHAQGKSLASAGDIVQTSQAGGGGSEQISLDLTKCSEGRGKGTLSSFGEKEKGAYCWKIKAGDQSGRQDHSRLTELLQKMWGRESKEQNWHMTSGTSWKSNCTERGGGWIIFGQGGEKEYLGYCDDSKNNRETSFIEVSQSSDSKSGGIKFCEKDCWTDLVDSQKPQQLSNKNESKWFELEFYKKQEK